MSFLDRVAGRGSSRASIESPSTPLTASSLAGVLGGAPSWSGVNVSPHGALAMSAVWACTKIYTDTIGSLPLKLHRRLPEGGKEPAVDHPLYDVLHSLSNSEMFAMAFRETLMGHALGWGMGYAEIQFNGFGQPVGLWPLMPNRTRAERRAGQKLVLTWVKDSSGEREVALPASRVFIIPGFGFDGLRGYSPIQMAKQAVGMGLAAEEFTSRFFSNGAHLGVVLETPKTLSPAVKSALRTEFEILHQGLSQAHRVAILEEDLKANKLALSPHDAQLIELMRFSVAQIARFYGVPLVLLEETDRSTSWGTGIEQFMLGWVMHRLRPWLVRWEQAINSQLLTADERKVYFAEFSIEGLLRGDSKARAEFYGGLFQVGALSPNQILELENMNGVGPEGDRRFVPMNMIPLDLAGAAASEGTEGGAGEDDAKAARSRAVVLRRERAALYRQRVRTMLLPIFEQACRRVVRKELAAARRILGKADGDGGGGLVEFVKQMDEFYLTFHESAGREISPGVQALAAAVARGIADETGVEPDSPPATVFVRRLVDRYVVGSQEAMRAAILADGVESVLGAWEETRAAGFAEEAAARASEALARHAYHGLGLSTAQRTSGCPLADDVHEPDAVGCRCVTVAA